MFCLCTVPSNDAGSLSNHRSVVQHMCPVCKLCLPVLGNAVCRAANDQQDVGLEGILGKISEKVPAIC